ncbi:hypothetical protein [Micromonospora sp. NPDC051006]|uniref:hypothetical protein n=1 Tax=Micromonospora sp. NPDC051006 TaxID=3364283 RepID=UPI0037A36FA7
MGVEAKICGYAVPLSADDVGGYAVFPLGWDGVVCFDDPELASTGRRATELEPEAPRVISVRPDGAITGASWPLLD